MSRAPWRADAPDRLPFTHAQAATAQATHPSWSTPIDLPLEAGSTITFDEQQAPRCTATLVTKAPLDDAVMAALDPRTGVRIKISAGYLWPDGVDVWPVTDLQLRDRKVSRPGDRMTLAASGEEARVIEAAGPSADYVLNASTVTTAAVDLLTTALGSAPVVVESTLPAVSPGDVTKVVAGQDWWTALDDIVDRVAVSAGIEGGDVWHDGLTGWHLTPRPTITTPAHALEVGRAGTVLTSEAGLSRDGWANIVQIAYRWTQYELRTDGAGRVYAELVNKYVLGSAQVSAGPLRPAVAGRVVYREDRDVPTSQQAADAVAAALLARKVSAGRSLDLDAISAWWLRPGDTITARLLTGASETHLVSAVTFDLTAGRMRVRTRRPDADATITQGA